MDFLFGHCEAIWPWPKHLKHLIALDLDVEGLEGTFSLEYQRKKFMIMLDNGEVTSHLLQVGMKTVKVVGQVRKRPNMVTCSW